MNRIRKALLGSIFAFLPAGVFSQSAPISIDGIFDDWTSNLTLVVDSMDSKSGLDLREVQIANDDKFLFIRIEADEEFDLTDNLVNQGLILCIDADNNASTGHKVRPNVGAELMVYFKDRFVEYYAGGFSKLGFSNISLRCAPTVTSTQFEIAISRTAVPDGKTKLFNSPNIKVMVLDTLSGDVLPTSEKGIAYTFDSTPLAPMTPVDIAKTDSNFLRVIAYNVKRNAITDLSKQDNFKGLISTLKPDVIGYSECYNVSPTDIKQLMDQWVPLGNSTGWHVSKKNGSDLITASKWPITKQWTSLDRQYPVLIDLPAMYSRDLLFTNAHLKCCDGDQQRQEQVDAYAQFVLDAKTSGGIIDLPDNTPMIYAGDLNLVGYAQQLRTLLTGDIQNTGRFGKGGALDWDDTDLTDAPFLQTDLRMNYTWRNDYGSYPPGKLDFIIFTDAVLQLEKTFVVQTEVMPLVRLQKYKWQSNYTGNASDHFPIICDFSVKEFVGVENIVNPKLEISPNPANNTIRVTGLKRNQSFKIISVLGREIQHGDASDMEAISVDGLANGQYFILFEDGQSSRFCIMR